MTERSEAVEEQAVRGASAGCPLEIGTANAEDVPPGYKRTEVGVIPQDWIVRPLGDVAELRNGYAFKSVTYRNDAIYKIITISNVQDGYISLDTYSGINSLPSDLQQHQILVAGDLLISMTGNVGRVCVVDRDNCLLNQRVGKIIPRSPDNRFLFFILHDRRFIREMIESAVGGAQGNISKNDILSYQCLIPGIKEEQRAIATALSNADALIESLDRLIAKKRAIKQGAMQQLLTGQTRLPGFTGEWETKRLGNHVSFLKTGTNSRAELTSNGRVAYLHYGDIHVRSSVTLNPNAVTTPYIAASKVRHLDKLAPGDLVFVDASEDLEGVGKSVEIIDVPKEGMVAGLHTIAARFDKDVLADGFKAYLQFCPQFIGTLRRLAAGTKVLATNRQQLASVEMELPCVAEQQAIAAVLSDMDAELESLERRRDKARQIKEGMMQQLLTGRVRLVTPEVAA